MISAKITHKSSIRSKNDKTEKNKNFSINLFDGSAEIRCTFFETTYKFETLKVRMYFYNHL